MPAAARKFDTRFQKLLTARDNARATAEAAAEELAAAKAEADTHEPVAELERILDLHGERADIDARLAEAATEAADATTARAEARRIDDAAREALVTTTAARDSARARAGAAGLRDLLEVGDPCPVCSQEVQSIPDHDVDAELEALVAAVEEQTLAVEASQDARAAADAAWERADATVVAFTERRDELDEALGGAPNLKSTNAALRAARKADATLQKVRARAESVLGALQDAEAGLAELDDEAAELRRELTGHRDDLVELEPPRPAERSIGDDWQMLAAWAKDQLGEAKSRKKEAVAAARAATKRADGHRKVIADLCRPHDGGSTPEDPVAWLASEIGRARAELSALEAEQAAQARTAERIDSLATEHAVAAELGRLLSARGFEQWLMADVMHTLAERATERLFDLSGGAYSLLTDGTDFSIRDHRNADEVRGARTLSGGETFLASLSLALALADNIADLAPEGAARIESMFLDEGFGTLDPETLDVVAGAIEDLGAEGRMIGVVTHIRELADRIPVRFEVSRTPTGSTVTRTTIG